MELENCLCENLFLGQTGECPGDDTKLNVKCRWWELGGSLKIIIAWEQGRTLANRICAGEPS